MIDLVAIACGAGLHDGLNPCIFMTCAGFIVHGFCLNSNSLRMGWLRFIFVLVYALSFFEFNFGPLQIFVLRKEFIFTAKIFYFVLGLWAFISGVLFFKDWLLLRRGPPAKDLTDKSIKPFVTNGFAVGLTTVMLAVVLSALAILAPINKYIFLLGSESLLKGLWREVMPVMAVYIFFCMWPLWFVWAFISVKNLRPSLLKIVCASIFFTASSCVVFLIK